MRSALRSPLRTPASAGAAVLTIALVLGAGVVLVALVEDVLWTPLAAGFGPAQRAARTDPAVMLRAE